MVAEKCIRKSAPVSRWNDDLATFADFFGNPQSKALGGAEGWGSCGGGKDLQFNPEIYSEDIISEEYKDLHRRIEECSFWGW